MSTELELKYRATAAQHAAIAAAFGDAFETIPMETTYYDTPDHLLSARHWTLRRRMEGSRSICTLKTPAGVGRREWEVEAASLADALPVLAAGLSEADAQVLRGTLVPVCGARFTRRAALIRQPDFAFELALDEGVLTGGGSEAPLMEVELELKSGSFEALGVYAAGFAARFGLTVQPKSKFARAKALSMGDCHG